MKREIDLRNIELRVEWTRKWLYRLKLPDMRILDADGVRYSGPLVGEEIDKRFAEKRRLARHMLNAINARVVKRAMKTAGQKVVPMMGRRQAT